MLDLIYLAEVPTEYDYGQAMPFEEYDVSALECAGVDVAAYWYAYGSYEGSGQLVSRKDGKWGLHDMGHCSCYGPLERWDHQFPYDTLDDLAHACSDEYWAQVRPLVALLRQRGYA